MSISPYDFAVESAISKLRKVKEGKLQACNIESPLEKIQFNMLKNLVAFELYLQKNPYLSVEDEPVEFYSMAFELSDIDTIFPLAALTGELNGT